MPQAFVQILGTVIASAAAGSVKTFIAKVFIYAAAAALLNAASRAMTPRNRSVGLGAGTELNYYDSGAPVRICYGKVRTGGMETIPPLTSGGNNEYLHKVLTLAGHEVDSFNNTYFDDHIIPNSAIGPMAFTTSDGQVMASNQIYNNLAWIRYYRGTATDSADRLLLDVSSIGFGKSRAPGIAKAAVMFQYDANVYRSVPTVTFTFQGKRVYDPRLDVTPGASPTNASYIRWSRNPALCLADYLMSDLGGGYASADIDWSSVVTAANYCDGTVNIPPATTQARYTCNGVLYANEDFTENVKALVNAMLGRVIFQDGKWRIYAGSWQTPSFTIQKEDWISGLSIRFEQGRGKRFNRMRCWYVDENRDWQRVESLPRSSSTYKTADGNEDLDAETEQLLCTNEYETQRKAEFLLRQSRNQITVAGKLPPRFQDIALWDTGTIVFDHLGWSSKTFRCVGADMHPDGSMDCVFLEEQSSDWTDLLDTEYNSPSTQLLPTQNATQPSAPQSLAISTNINGTLTFAMGMPLVRPFNTRFQIIRSTNSANAAVGTIIYDGADLRVNLVMPASRHWYWSRSYVNPNSPSAYQPNTFGVLGEPLGWATQQIQQNAVTATRVSSTGFVAALAVPNSGGSLTISTNCVAFTNTHNSSIAIQLEASVVNANVSWDGSAPSVRQSSLVFTTNSSGNNGAGSRVVASYPDGVTEAAATFTGAYAVELIAGDTISVRVLHELTHDNDANLNFDQSVVRLAAYVR